MSGIFRPTATRTKPVGIRRQSRSPSYQEILDVAGKPGGLLLDLFSGSGTGSVAASEWGMRSVSIEREAAYVQMIRQRVAAKSQQS